jgi:hypothetical protein
MEMALEEKQTVTVTATQEERLVAQSEEPALDPALAALQRIESGQQYMAAMLRDAPMLDATSKTEQAIPFERVEITNTLHYQSELVDPQKGEYQDRIMHFVLHAPDAKTQAGEHALFEANLDQIGERMRNIVASIQSLHQTQTNENGETVDQGMSMAAHLYRNDKLDVSVKLPEGVSYADVLEELAQKHIAYEQVKTQTQEPMAAAPAQEGDIVGALQQQLAETRARLAEQDRELLGMRNIIQEIIASREASEDQRPLLTKDAGFGERIINEPQESGLERK